MKKPNCYISLPQVAHRFAAGGAFLSVCLFCASVFEYAYLPCDPLLFVMHCMCAYVLECMCVTVFIYALWQMHAFLTGQRGTDEQTASEGGPAWRLCVCVCV